MTTATAIEPLEPVAAHSGARPLWLPVLPALCMISAAISWLAGGVALLNDISWIAMTLVCLFYVLLELHAFPYRLGVGGIVMWVGVLVWLCADYLKNWSGGASAGASEWMGASFSDDLLAKATFMHFLFITMAAIGFLIPWGWWLPRLIAKTPQPANPHTLLLVIIALFLFSLLPYFLFTAVPWYKAIWVDLTAFRSGARELVWTVGRTGRLNVAWGGYIAFWSGLVMFAGVLAVFYALFMTRHRPTQVLCWSIWLFSLARAFGTGSRREVLVAAAPMLFLLFIRYHAKAVGYNQWFRGHRFKAYAVTTVLFLGVYGLMQIQGYNRRGSLGEMSLDIQQFVDPKDNVMFTSALMLFELVPKERPYFYSRFFGEGLVRVIPQTVYEFFLGAIPRALWQSKPTNKVDNWANIVRQGAVDFGPKGPVMPQGLVGHYWVRYGPIGVIEGGLLFGWLLCAIERAIWLSSRKPLILIIGLGLAEFMFLSFRDLRWQHLYQFLIGIAALWLLSLFASKRQMDEPMPEYQ